MELMWQFFSRKKPKNFATLFVNLSHVEGTESNFLIETKLLKSPRIFSQNIQVCINILTPLKFTSEAFMDWQITTIVISVKIY